jgi:hypothetical protein
MLLKELYVRQSQQGRGVGRALMAWVARHAVERGCARVDWNVSASNHPGLAFHRSLGALHAPGRLSFRRVQYLALGGTYEPADLGSWPGANRRHAAGRGEDLQRRHGAKGAAHQCRIASNTALGGEHLSRLASGDDGGDDD